MEESESVRFVVAGGNGYIGSHLTHHLFKLGHEVVVYDRDGAPNDFARVVEGELEDEALLLRTLIEFKPQGLYHLGSPSAMPDSFRAPSQYLSEVGRVTDSILKACEQSMTRNLVFSSSCSVYGDAISADETSDIRPLSPYAESKVLAENKIRLAASRGLILAGVFRFFNVIGCDSDNGLSEKHKPETHVLPLLVSCAISGKTFELFGESFDTYDGTPVRDYVDVRDIARGLSLGMKRVITKNAGSFEVWNLGSSRPLSVMELIRIVERSTGKVVAIQRRPARQGDPGLVFSKSSRVKRELGWEPQVGVEDSVRSVIKSIDREVN